MSNAEQDLPEEEVREWPASEFETFECPNCGAHDWEEITGALTPTNFTPPDTSTSPRRWIKTSKTWGCRVCGADLTITLDVDEEQCTHRLERLDDDVKGWVDDLQEEQAERFRDKLNQHVVDHDNEGEER